MDWPNIRLTPLCAADASQMNEWQNDPEIRELLMGFRGPVSLETTQDWIKGLRESNLKSRVVFGIRKDGQLAGMINLFDIDWLHRNAKLGVFVGEPSARSHGIGYAATALLLDYAFDGLGLERIALEVIASNARARGVYERLGFAEEGLHRSAYFCAGRREDVAFYALLRPDWTRPVPETANRLVMMA